MTTHKKTIMDELAVTEKPDFSDTDLGVLGKAAQRLVDKQDEIIEMEIELKGLKREERKINQEEVPELMENFGIESITLPDGRKIAVRDSIQIGIPAPVRDKAYGWLDKNGHGDLIKTLLTAKFNRGDKDSAHNAQKALAMMEINADLIESVHAGTLKAWAREELAQGHKLPASFFKVHVVKITKVS